MPNYCSNQLTIHGDEKTLKEFSDFLKKGEGTLDFNLFAQYPEKFKVLDDIAQKAREKAEKTKDQADWARIPRDGYNQGGYEWCIENWGTKWNAIETNIAYGSSTIVVLFDTAWSPPLPIVHKMSEMFPTLKFTIKYSEEGMGFEGQNIFYGGKLVSSTETQRYTEDEDEGE